MPVAGSTGNGVGEASSTVGQLCSWLFNLKFLLFLSLCGDCAGDCAEVLLHSRGAEDEGRSSLSTRPSVFSWI